ncbi:MAG: penicillin-binding protein 2 [Thiotrichales bacterium]
MARRQAIKDTRREIAIFGLRATVVVVITLGLLTLVAVRMVNLQIVWHEHYRDLANNNRVRLVPIPPGRGLVYDRNGVLLADNLTSYNLEITPEQVRDLPNTLQRLGEIVVLTDDDISRFQRQRRITPAFRSVPVRFNLSDEDVAAFYLNHHLFDGVEVQARLTRTYPMGELFAHALGYVGRISERDLETIDERQYQGSTHTGKIGVERFYESLLHGAVGVRHEEVNSTGRRVRVLREDAPSAGQGLVLTLDHRLQRVALEALGSETGSVVAIDPRNGEVLALVSTPIYDPNLFVNGISVGDYARLRDDPERPLINRAINGQYPPGSTIKPITGLAGLEHGVTTAERTMFAAPYYSLPNSEHQYRDWLKTGHGWVNLDRAITQSSDVYFYDLSYKLGVERLHEVFSRFKFGQPTGIDLPSESSGLMPSAAWKVKRHKKPWYPGETLILGIGQGYMLSTPLQLAAAVACMAQRGQCYNPHLLKAVIGSASESRPKRSDQPDYVVPVRDPRHWDQILKPMQHVVHAPNGTAYRAGHDTAYQWAGKTGTSQVFSIKQDERYDAKKLRRELRDHALFVGYAPLEAPRIAIAVVIEHGGGGGAVAAPIARKVIDVFMALQKERGEQLAQFRD